MARGPRDAAHRIEVYRATTAEMVMGPKQAARLLQSWERFSITTATRRSGEDVLRGLLSAIPSTVSQRAFPVYNSFFEWAQRVIRRGGGLTPGNKREIHQFQLGLIAEGFDKFALDHIEKYLGVQAL